MQLITPKSAVEIVLHKKTKDAKIQIFKTKVERLLFRLCIGFLLLGVVIALFTYVTNYAFFEFFALLSVVISLFFAIVLQLAGFIISLLKFRNPERELIIPFLTDFNDDIELINELVDTTAIHHLTYAHSNFLMLSKQLRERIGLLVGALEKVGLIPLATTGYFAFLKAQNDNLQPFSEIGWAFIAFAFLYIFAIRMMGAAHWLERMSAIYQQAIDIKIKNASRKQPPIL